jgi:hypothetical protein
VLPAGGVPAAAPGSAAAAANAAGLNAPMLMAAGLSTATALMPTGVLVRLHVLRRLRRPQQGCWRPAVRTMHPPTLLLRAHVCAQVPRQRSSRLACLLCRPCL